MASFSAPVWVLISLTLAPGMLALVESCTTPATVAVLTWAEMRIPEQEARKKIKVRKNRYFSFTESRGSSGWVRDLLRVAIVRLVLGRMHRRRTQFQGEGL